MALSATPLVLLLLLALAGGAAATEGDASTPTKHFGFNPKINWLSFEAARSVRYCASDRALLSALTTHAQASLETRKPVLLAIWLPGDEHTEEVRKMFDDERIVRLSANFLMVTAPWGSDTAVAKQWDLYPYVYATQMDGAYTPRVVFLHEGKAQLLTNRDLLNYRWYYYHPDSLVRSMEEAVEVFLYGAPLKPPAGWVSANETNTASKPEGVTDAPPAPAPAPPKPIRAKTLLERKIELERMAKEIQELEEQEKKKNAPKEEL